jgi:hypothetical protein
MKIKNKSPIAFGLPELLPGSELKPMACLSPRHSSKPHVVRSLFVAHDEKR